MHILNITTNISETVHLEWLAWMNTTFIPAMLATKKFHKALITEVQVDEEMGGVTYSTQYFTDSKKNLDLFLKEDQQTILSTYSKFKGLYVDFSTHLKVINEH